MSTYIHKVVMKNINSEEKCLEYFPVLKECFFMILDEWEEKRKKEEKAINSALSKITSQIT